MTEKDKTSSTNNVGSQSGNPKRPSATIDLKANENKKSGTKKDNGDKASYMMIGKSSISQTTGNFLAGLCGGVLVVTLFYLFQFIGLLPNASLSSNENSNNLVGLASKIEKSAENKIKKQAEKTIAKYNQRLNQIEQKITAIAGSADSKDGANIAQAAAITNLLTELETNFDKKMKSLRGQLETQINDTVGQISSDLKKTVSANPAIKSNPGNSNIIRQLLDDSTADLNKNISQLNSQTDQLSKAMSALRNSNSDFKGNLAALNNNISQVNLQIKNISDEFARLKEKTATKETVTPLSKKVIGLDKRLTTALETNQFQQKNTTRTALSIAFTGLKKAADRGEPFSQELETIKKIAPEYSSLDTLSKFELKGIASFKSLQQQFPGLLRKAIALANQPKSPSLLDKATNTVVSLVKFRRKGNVSGDDAEAILARMEYNLNQGNYEKVLEEAKALRAGPARLMESWVTQLDARLKLDETLQKIEMALLSQLGANGNLDKGNIN